MTNYENIRRILSSMTEEQMAHSDILHCGMCPYDDESSGWDGHCKAPEGKSCPDGHMLWLKADSDHRTLDDLYPGMPDEVLHMSRPMTEQEAETAQLSLFPEDTEKEQ